MAVQWYLFICCCSVCLHKTQRMREPPKTATLDAVNTSIIKSFAFSYSRSRCVSLSLTLPSHLLFIICCVDRIRVPRSLRKSLLCCTSTLLTWCRIKSKFTHRSREEILLPHKIIYFDFFFLFFFAVLAVYSLRLQLCLWGCGLIKSETWSHVHFDKLLIIIIPLWLRFCLFRGIIVWFISRATDAFER